MEFPFYSSLVHDRREVSLRDSTEKVLAAKDSHFDVDYKTD